MDRDGILSKRGAVDQRATQRDEGVPTVGTVQHPQLRMWTVHPRHCQFHGRPVLGIPLRLWPPAHRPPYPFTAPAIRICGPQGHGGGTDRSLPSPLRRREVWGCPVGGLLFDVPLICVQSMMCRLHESGERSSPTPTPSIHHAGGAGVDREEFGWVL